MSESDTTENENNIQSEINQAVSPPPLPDVAMLVPEFSRVILANFNTNKLVDVVLKNGINSTESYIEDCAEALTCLAEKMAIQVNKNCKKIIERGGQ